MFIAGKYSLFKNILIASGATVNKPIVKKAVIVTIIEEFFFIVSISLFFNLLYIHGDHGLNNCNKTVYKTLDIVYAILYIPASDSPIIFFIIIKSLLAYNIWDNKCGINGILIATALDT